MTTMTEFENIRKFTNEDTLRRQLMKLEKRDVIELYLQLRFDKLERSERK